MQKKQLYIQYNITIIVYTTSYILYISQPIYENYTHIIIYITCLLLQILYIINIWIDVDTRNTCNQDDKNPPYDFMRLDGI